MIKWKLNRNSNQKAIHIGQGVFSIMRVYFACLAAKSGYCIYDSPDVD